MEHGLELAFDDVAGHDGLDEEEEVKHGVLVEAELEQLVLNEEVEHGTVDEEELEH